MLARLGLPVDLDAEPLTAALRWVAYDKKRQGDAIRFILVRAPGAVEMTENLGIPAPRLARPPSETRPRSLGRSVAGILAVVKVSR